MRASVIRIGNSRGIRIPKAILEECRLGNQVELEVHSDYLAVKPLVRPRVHWEEAFQKMAAHRDDRLEKGWPRSTWDDKEWAW